MRGENFRCPGIGDEEKGLMAEKSGFHSNQTHLNHPCLNLSHAGEMKSQVWDTKVILFHSNRDPKANLLMWLI